MLTEAAASVNEKCLVKQMTDILKHVSDCRVSTACMEKLCGLLVLITHCVIPTDCSHRPAKIGLPGLVEK